MRLEHGLHFPKRLRSRIPLGFGIRFGCLDENRLQPPGRHSALLGRDVRQRIPHPVHATGPDRLGNEMKPREWFFVPLHAIIEAIERIQDGSLHKFEYQPEQARLTKKL